MIDAKCSWLVYLECFGSAELENVVEASHILAQPVVEKGQSCCPQYDINCLDSVSLERAAIPFVCKQEMCVVKEVTVYCSLNTTCLYSKKEDNSPVVLSSRNDKDIHQRLSINNYPLPSSHLAPSSFRSITAPLPSKIHHETLSFLTVLSLIPPRSIHPHIPPPQHHLRYSTPFIISHLSNPLILLLNTSNAIALGKWQAPKTLKNSSPRGLKDSARSDANDVVVILGRLRKRRMVEESMSAAACCQMSLWISAGRFKNWGK